MGFSNINRGSFRFKTVVKFVTSRIPVKTLEEAGVDNILLARKITFYKRTKGGRIQQTVSGQSGKRPYDEIDDLEEQGVNLAGNPSAFGSCMAQIDFSYDYYKERDRAYISFIPIQREVDKAEFVARFA